MVSKITIFEPHFEDTQFGPASLGPSEDDDTDEAASPADGSRWPGLLVLGVLGAALLTAGIVLRRLRDAEDLEEVSISAPVQE